MKFEIIDPIPESLNIDEFITKLKNTPDSPKKNSKLRKICCGIIFVNTLLSFVIIINAKFGRNLMPRRNEPVTLNYLWSYKTYQSIFSTPAIGKLNNNKKVEVVCASYDGNIYGLDGTSGKRNFYFSTEKGIISSVLLYKIGAGRILVASLDKKVYLLDSFGRVIWATLNTTIETNIYSTPALCYIDSDKIIDLIFGTAGNSVYALNGLYGWVIWKNTDLKGPFFASPAVIGKYVIICSQKGIVYALEKKTGFCVWSYYTEGPINSSPVVFQNDKVIVSDEWGFLYIIELKSGKLLAKHNFETGTISSPIILHNKIILPLKSGKIIAFNLLTEKEIWRFDTQRQDSFTASPAVYDFNNDNIFDIVIPSKGGYIYIIDCMTGKDLCTPYNIGSAISSSVCIGDVNSDGFADLVFGGEDGKIYCLTVTTPKKNLSKNKIVWPYFRYLQCIS